MSHASSGPAPLAARQAFRRRRKQIIVLVALLPVLVAAWIPLLRASRPRPAAAASAPPADDTAVAAATPTSHSDRSTRLATLRARRLAAADPVRFADPFIASAHTAASPIEPSHRPDELGPTGLVPSSIAMSKTALPVAVIRGRTYRPGDEVDGLVITAIEERRVVFRRGQQVFETTLPEPSVGRTHD